MIYLRQLMSELISHIDYSNMFKAYPYKIDTIKFYGQFYIMIQYQTMAK